MTIDAQTRRLLILGARQFYQTLDAWHNETHGERVVANALKLAASEPIDPDLVELAAWVHQYHDNLDDLRLLLSKHGVAGELFQTLYRVAEVCRPHKIDASCSLLERIVFDADAIELMGAYGIVRELFCNVQCRNMPLESAISSAQNVQTLFSDSLQTEAARELVRESIRVAGLFWQDLHKFYQI